jgi:protein TonB
VPAIAPQSPPVEHTTSTPVSNAAPQNVPQSNAQNDAASRAAAADAHVNAASGPETTGADRHAAGSAAHAVYQPLPEVPDEAREEAFTAVALARFTVHVDGHCDVSLVEPTRNPTLNRLLLTSLRQWRFAPATEGGHAVETTIDLRVHFNVQ